MPHCPEVIAAAIIWVNMYIWDGSNAGKACGGPELAEGGGLC